MIKICAWSLILGVVSMCTQPVSSSRACIIGAGSSGLLTARYMKEYGMNITVFEATRYIGGIWRYNPRVGTNEDGFREFPSVYKNMRSNIVLEVMTFRDFPFPKGLPTFVPATCIYEYIQAYAKHFDLMKHIQFRSRVTGVRWTGHKWNMTYLKSGTRTYITEECNFVVVATGEEGAPNMPYFEKQEEFRGKIIHSQDFKDAEHFRDVSVLVIGAGPSGYDFVAQLINVTSKLMHSHHDTFKLPNITGNYKMKPDIKHFTQNGAIFVDGSAEEFDVAILCTGYSYFMPFLNYQSTGVAATGSHVLPLYNQVVNINHPSMAFVGIVKLAILTVHEMQAQYTAALASGKFQLPSQEYMFEHWFNHTKNLNITDINKIGYLNTEPYLDELLQEIDLPRPPLVFTKLIKNV